MDILSLLAGDRNQEVRDANSRCAQERWFFQAEIRNQDTFLNALCFKVRPLDQQHLDSLRLAGITDTQTLLHWTYWLRIHGLS